MTSVGSLTEPSLEQESVLVRIHRMCLDFDDVIAREREDARETARRLQGRQREEKVGDTVPPRQPAVDHPPIEAIQVALLARLEREAPSDDATGGQQALREDVGAQMHVVVAVESNGVRTVKTAELVDLRADDVVEVTRQSGAEDGLREAMPPKISAQDRLTLGEARRAVGGGERRREVEVQTGVDAVLASERGRALRVAHEHHGAHGGDR